MEYLQTVLQKCLKDKIGNSGEPPHDVTELANQIGAYFRLHLQGHIPELIFLDPEPIGKKPCLGNNFVFNTCADILREYIRDEVGGVGSINLFDIQGVSKTFHCKCKAPGDQIRSKKLY
jgi:hypothetical protein